MNHRIIYKKLTALSILICSIILPQAVFSGTVWVNATFYDYKTNGTNPDFENCNPGTRVLGMVRGDTLTIDRKPLHRTLSEPPVVCYSHLNEWFRPSGVGGSAYDWRTLRWTNLNNFQGRTNEWVGPVYDGADPMACVVIYDSLPFITVGGGSAGTVEYNNQNFFLLDGKGYGDEGKTGADGKLHNFGFTMEIHHEFTYRGGEFFKFTGDDDVWVFINGRLALDIGGIHSAVSDSFFLDRLPPSFNLVKGNREPYIMDFFYCERHTNKSTIKITSNILSRLADKLEISVDKSVISPDEVANLTAVVYDQFGNPMTGMAGLVKWDILNLYEKPGDVLAPAQGEKSAFTPSEGYRKVVIVAEFQDPDYSDYYFRDTIEINILPPDLEGPEIKKVLYYYGSIPGSGGNNPDTLVVYFNEGVKCDTLKDSSSTPQSIFIYYPENIEGEVFNGADFSQSEIISCNDTLNMLVIILPSQGLVTPNNDKLKITPGALEDIWGNRAPEDGPAVTIEWGREYPWIASTSPNPFDPQKDIIPDFVKNSVAGDGKPIPSNATTIEVVSVRGIDYDRSYADIYDVVGNVVRKRLLAYRTGRGNKTTYFFWDGRNANGRIVGAGTYLAVINIQELDVAGMAVKKQKIGLTRSR